MDVLVLLGSFALLCALAVPVAYALGLSALFAALWTDIPLEAVMLKISTGPTFRCRHPFFFPAGIMAEAAWRRPINRRGAGLSAAASRW
jgi:hypothetical protein